VTTKSTALKSDALPQPQWIQNKSIFTNPFRVTNDSCHNVYVIDKRDNSSDRVVVLGQAGEVRGIYCGCGKASDFKAVDLVVTELDNIIVLDIYSKACE
jgi:hypothetical protein